MSRAAETQKRIDAYVASVLSAAPPMSAELAGRVLRTLDAVKPPRKLNAKEKREAAARVRADEARARASRLERERTACAVCGVPKVGHYYNDSLHAWEGKNV